MDLKQNTLEFCHVVNSWENRKAGMDLVMKHVLQKNLPAYVHETDDAYVMTPPMKKARKQDRTDQKDIKFEYTEFENET
jgi:hypothetical protein